MDFEWDPAKRLTNLVKHGLDFADVPRLNWDEVTILEDRRFAYGEKRYWAVGVLDGYLHMVAFTRQENIVRVISFRRASRKERMRYG
jgi:uncharacterized DUF497 family protein